MKGAYFLKRSTGFTLIEVLVAFSILAISFATIYQVFGTGMKNSVIANEYFYASQYASSLLDELDASKDIQFGISSGKFDKKFSWKLHVYPSDEHTFKKQTVMAVNVLANVYWGKEGKKREFSIETMRIVNPLLLSDTSE